MGHASGMEPGRSPHMPFRLHAEFRPVGRTKKSEQPLIYLCDWRACHAEGRRFEPGRSRQSFQSLSWLSRANVIFRRPWARRIDPKSSPSGRFTRIPPVSAVSVTRFRPERSGAKAPRCRRRIVGRLFRAKTHCCVTHSAACAFLCAALRDRGSFSRVNSLDFLANRRPRLAQNRRTGGMFLR
jgi:hypothetical protein